MNVQRLALAVTGINLVLLVGLLGQTLRPAVAGESVGSARTETGELPMLRARGLEIVDDQGRVRALLAVMPPAVVDGKQYPETVLLRLIDPKSGPVVKLTADVGGGALGLTDGAEGGVRVFAKEDGSYVNVVSRDGKTARLEP